MKPCQSWPIEWATHTAGVEHSNVHEALELQSSVRACAAIAANIRSNKCVRQWVA